MDKMLRTFTHPFVPNPVAFARRDIMLTKETSGGGAAMPETGRCSLRFLDAASFASKVRARDWIVTRAADDERHLWRIVEASGPNERRQLALCPMADVTPALFTAVEDDQREAIYYSRIVQRSTTWTSWGCTC